MRNENEYIAVELQPKNVIFGDFWQKILNMNILFYLVMSRLIMTYDIILGPEWNKHDYNFL